MPATTATAQNLPPYMFRPETTYHWTSTEDGVRSYQEDAVFINSNLHNELVRQQHVDVIMDHFQRQLKKHTDRIEKIFVQKFEAQKSVFKEINNVVVFKSAALVTVWAAATNPLNMNIDVTEDCSVIFTLTYSDGSDVYLELYFEPLATEPVQHNLNIYRNGNPVFSYAGDLRRTLGLFLSKFQPVVKIPV